MKTFDIRSGFSANDLGAVAGLLREGKVGILPTETVYGLAARASDPEAVERVCSLKGRPAGKPLPVQVAGLGEASRLAVIDDPAALEIAHRFWPGPLTLVLECRPDAVLPCQDGVSIGIRVPRHEFCLALLERTGPLVVPSANRSGHAPPTAPPDIETGLKDLADFLVDAGECEGGTESTVVDVRGGVRVLREGAIPASEFAGL